MLTTLADLRPSSYDAKARTVEVVLAAGERLLMGDGAGLHDGPCFIVLGTRPEEVRLGRLNSGRLNLLNNHGDVNEGTYRSSYDVENIVGVFEKGSASFETVEGSAALVARVRLSARPEVAGVVQDVGDGVIAQVSPGFRVYRWRLEGDIPADGTPPTFRAVDWEPREVSLTACPAQSTSYVLSDHGEYQTEVELTAVKQGDLNMTPAEKIAAAARAKSDEQTLKASETAIAVQTDAEACELAATERLAAVKGETARVVGIQKLCATAGLGADVATGLIDRQVALAEARVEVLEKWSQKVGSQTPATGVARVEVNDVELKGENAAIESALLSRGVPALFPHEKLSDQARKFHSYSLLELSAHLLERRGTNVRGRPKNELYALSMHATSDFPLLLANVAGKSLRDQYQAIARTWQLWARQGTLPDFKPTSRVQLGGAPTLDEIPETGQVPMGTVGEMAESIQVKSYGKRIGFSRAMMINDDLSAFTRIPSLFGAAAARLEDDLAYAILTANAAMADTVVLFHATHKNLSSGAGSAFAAAGVGAAESLLMQQTGQNGEYLNLPLMTLVVPSALAFAAKQLVAPINAVTAGTVNPYTGSKVNVVTSPRLDGTSAIVWYAFCDPAYCDTVEVAFLAGESGPRVETRLGWEVEGMEIKCMHDVGVKALDWRGMVKSAGA
jgi:hypothetical protein